MIVIPTFWLCAKILRNLIQQKNLDVFLHLSDTNLIFRVVVIKIFFTDFPPFFFEEKKMLEKKIAICLKVESSKTYI